MLFSSYNSLEKSFPVLGNLNKRSRLLRHVSFRSNLSKYSFNLCISTIKHIACKHTQQVEYDTHVKIIWETTPLSCMLWNGCAKINMQDPETLLFNCHWRNHVAINCMQSPLLNSSPVLKHSVKRLLDVHIIFIVTYNLLVYLCLYDVCVFTSVCMCFRCVRTVPLSHMRPRLMYSKHLVYLRRFNSALVC